MGLEKQFAQLEAQRPDYPKGKRMQPIAAGEPCNTLIWEAEFPDLASAYQALDLFQGDPDHETLLRQQVRYFLEVRVEFYRNLEV
jgi:hypothetical protein